MEFDDERKNLKAPTPEQYKQMEKDGYQKNKPMHSDGMLLQGWLVLLLGAAVLGVICYYAFAYLPNGS